ncbi:MAG: cation:proton antiporter [Haloferacaceae archaeon]
MAAGSGLEAELIDVLAVFIIAGAVGVFVAKYAEVPYTIALLVAGFAASVAGVEVGIRLTHDIILLVLLPPLLFEGAATTDLDAFRRDLPVIATLAIVGLLLSIALVGVAARYVLGLPMLVAVLFATMILPTDPVSVLALFEDIGAPDRLAVLVEGESLLNDGVAVVVFTALLALVESGADPSVLTTPARLADLAVGIGFSSVGGAVVGFLAGYLVYRVMVNLDEHMTEIVLTVILAYGSFLVAEHYLHVSGVIATVAAGLFMGNRGREYAMSARTKISVFNAWATAAFIVNTFIFLVIGAQTPLGRILAYGHLLVPAIALVVLGRAAVVYPLTALANRLFVTDRDPVSRDYQHVLVWGGLHASIPIALALGLPPGVPFREEMRVMTFGVAAFSLVVQGLTVGRLVDALGIVTTTEAERLYQLLVGRARAVDEVLDAADRLRDRNRISQGLYDRFTGEYEAEKADLRTAIATLLDGHPELRTRERLVGERQLLLRERAAIHDAEHDGLVAADVADELLEEVNVKLDRVDRGETTVLEPADEEGYEEYWRRRAREFGVLDGSTPPDE